MLAGKATLLNSTGLNFSSSQGCDRMDTLMCHRATRERFGDSLLGLLLLTALTAAAQTPSGPARPNWRRIGSAAVDLALASPATGPVSRVWFSPEGARLYALTASGRFFESADLETWSVAVNPSQPPNVAGAAAVRLPATGARLYPQNSGRVFALGAHLYRSDDSGASWTNLTAYTDASVIGGGQHDLAVSPRDPDLLIVANDYGVWRAAAGGLSWSGLNQFLPNLRVRRILATPQGLAGTRVAVDGAGLLELQPGGDKEWQPIADLQLSAQLERDANQRRAVSQQLGAEITALGGSGEIRYAGALDGRIWISSDSGQTWRNPRPSSGNAVASFYVDQQEARIAMAVLGGRAAHVLRTINAGVSWDDLSANLPDTGANAIPGDRCAAAAYVAPDSGLVFRSR